MDVLDSFNTFIYYNITLDTKHSIIAFVIDKSTVHNLSTIYSGDL